MELRSSSFLLPSSPPSHWLSSLVLSFVLLNILLFLSGSEKYKIHLDQAKFFPKEFFFLGLFLHVPLILPFPSILSPPYKAAPGSSQSGKMRTQLMRSAAASTRAEVNLGSVTDQDSIREAQNILPQLPKNSISRLIQLEPRAQPLPLPSPEVLRSSLGPFHMGKTSLRLALHDCETTRFLSTLVTHLNVGKYLQIELFPKKSSQKS